ncbi:UDP-glucose 4-epimerase GalE [Planctomycetota bacterium]
MRVLATGGAGYVGSAMVRLLLGRGYEVMVYDNLSKGYRAAVPVECLIEGDLAESDKLVQVLKEHHIDVVAHFAGSIAVGESMENPRHYYRNNIGNSLLLLEAMQDSGVEKIIFSSTAAVYAPVAEGVLTEDSPLGPANPYAVSKYTIERMIEDFAGAYGWSYVMLRYFNACGASEDGQYGEAHDPETHLIPMVLQAALGQREKISIFGTDYDTPDGTCIRDYVHVDDLAEAHIMALKAVEAGRSSIYNVGTGTGNSVLEVLRAAQEVVGAKIPTEITGRRAGDTSRLVASSKRLRQDWGWQPKHQELKDVIKTAWGWHQTHPDGYQE